MVSFLSKSHDKESDFRQPNFSRSHKATRSPMNSEATSLEASQLAYDIAKMYEEMSTTEAQVASNLETLSDGGDAYSLYDGVGVQKLLKSAVFFIDAQNSVSGEQTVINQGTGSTALNAQYGSTTGVDANDPLLLTHTGENYVYISDVAGNFLSVPDAANLDITGDLELVCRVGLSDWTPAGFMSLLGKSFTAYELYVSNGSSGSLILGVQVAAVQKTFVIVAPPFTDGVIYWLKVTFDADNGSGGATAKFYYAADQVIEPTVWTQTGGDQIQAGVMAIDTNALVASFGARPDGTLPSDGKFLRGIIRNSIGGTTVLDVNCATNFTNSNATSFTATSGQTVTVNRSTSGRKTALVTRPIWLFGTDDYMQVADNALLDFGASDSFTTLAIVRQWATPRAFGMYVSKANAYDDGWSLSTSNTSVTAYGYVDNGVNSGAALSPFTPGASTVVGFVLNRSLQTIASFANATLSSTASTSVIGTLANALPMRIGVDAANSTNLPQDMELLAVAVFRQALTVDEIADVCTYYATATTIPTYNTDSIYSITNRISALSNRLEILEKGL